MKHFELLSSTPLFRETSEFECQAMMFCFKTKFKTFNKNEVIFKQGDSMEYVALILKGSAKVEHVDTLGNITIHYELEHGGMYGVESAYANLNTYNDSLIATQKSFVLFLDKHRLITPCSNRCKRHETVVKNLMQIVAERNLQLLNKLTHISKKSIREKVISYLLSQSQKTNSTYFDIPFNKTELAEYLAVDRSAMSSELNKMKKEGLIDFDKKQYHLIKIKE